jgi:hypothetical protein
VERSTKQSWLEGPGDLKEEDVLDVPVEGQSIRVRGLPAAYSNEATSKALELITGARGEQTARINQHKLEVIQFAHGCVEPTFTEPEAELVAQKYGPAFKKAIAEIDRLSGVDKEAIEKTNATFPSGGSDEGGPHVGNGTSAGDR